MPTINNKNHRNLVDGKEVYYTLAGRLYTVTGMFDNDEAANRWMEANPGQGVLGLCGRIVMCGRTQDGGFILAQDRNDDEDNF